MTTGPKANKGSMMKSYPVLFNGDMVRAILAGRKSQTRRPMKQAPRLASCEDIAWQPHWCPYGVPGDELWVRETHATGVEGCPNGVSYRADHIDPRGDGPAHPMKWTPSILMPRVLARIHLTVTDVRIQRVQDISEEDAVAEGAQRFDAIPVGRLGSPARWSMGTPATTDQCLGTPRFAFGNAWEKAYQDGWDRNPWLWAITFEVKK